MRYNYYSHVHKFMRQYLAKFESLVATIDFSSEEQTSQIKEEFANFTKLLEMHADHEDRVYHLMLQQKEPLLFEQMESEHQVLDEQLSVLSNMLDSALATDLLEDEQHALGYQFYLAYTDYMSMYFKHLFLEEKILMPTLQKHYSDKELRAVTFNTYNHMTADHMLDMLRRLYPYLNRYDRQVFLDDIAESHPEKFSQIFPAVLDEIEDPQEQQWLSQREWGNLVVNS